MRTGIALGVLFIASGCSSYESTYLGRDNEGKPLEKKVAGVPIVVTVPQKIGFLVTETDYQIDTFVSNPDGTQTKGKPRVVTETTIDRTPIPLGYSQLVNLDIKRPAYGSAETSMELEAQYPTKLSSKVNDQTLGRILDTVEKVLPTPEKQGVGTDDNRTIIRQRTYMIVYDPETLSLSRVRL